MHFQLVHNLAALLDIGMNGVRPFLGQDFPRCSFIVEGAGPHPNKVAKAMA